MLESLFLNQIMYCITKNEIKSINAKFKDTSKDLVSEGDGMKCLEKPLKVKKLLGEGFFGKVYEVDKKTVVKIVKVNLGNKRRFNIDNVKSELELSKKAGKLGVGPKVYNVYTCCDGLICYYVIYMEFIKGKTLWQWLSGKRTDEEKQNVKLLLQKKLRILHKNNIVHSDVHGDNIIVISERNKVKDLVIIDYGLAINKSNVKLQDYNIDWIFRDLNKDQIKYHEITDYVLKRMLDNEDVKIM
jgi:predicted Ser/Thr protein kinase